MKLKKINLLIAVVFIAIFLRFFRLGDVPTGLYQDETAIGYNAYSIQQSGKDEYGKSFPLYFKSFGDQKLPVYIYVDVLSIKLFGLTPFAVRFPSALFGVLSVIALFFFIRDLTRNENLALVSSFLLAINPWSLHYNRGTFEVSIALFLFITGGHLLNKFFRQNFKSGFLLGTLCFVMGLYTYNLTRLLSPLLFALFIFTNKENFKKSSKKEMALTIAVAVLFLIPFGLTILKSGGVSSAQSTLIFSSAAVQAPLQEMRLHMLSMPFGIPYIFFNKYVLTFWQYITNIISYFSVEFFFIKGSAHGNHGIGNVGYFYLFELPLIILGSFYLFKKKVKGLNTLVWWAIITILIASLTRDVPHATRSFFLLVPLVVFSSAGIIYAYNLVNNFRGKIKYIVLLGFFALAFYNIFYYFTSYYIRFPVVYAKAWRIHDKELSNYLIENEKKYEKIIIDNDAAFIYTSLLFYSKYSPTKFQDTVQRLPDDAEGFSKVKSIGKYEFRNIDWKKDIQLKNTIIVTNSVENELNHFIIKKFYYPTRPYAIADNQQILPTSVKEESYVVLRTK